MIFIKTGSIRTGKTTALWTWAAQRNDVSGVLSPDDAQGKRYFLNLKTQEKWQLEAGINSKAPTLSIGRFCFLKSAFDKANKVLLDAANNSQNVFIVIDELGKLELKNDGLDSAAKVLIPKREHNPSQHLILVIRDTLIKDIIAHYKHFEYQRFSEDL